MANQLASNPWSIDTPSASPLYLGNMPHVQIELVNYNVATIIAEVQNRYGRTIAFLTADSDFTTVRTGRMGWVYGVLVPLTTVNAAGTTVPNLAGATTAATAVSRTGGVTTLTFAAAAPFTVGQSIAVSGVSDPSFNGTFIVTGVTTVTPFTVTYNQPTLPNATPAGGATVAAAGRLLIYYE
jgi:hypothetical protein